MAVTVFQQACVRGVRRLLASMCGAAMADHIIGLLRPRQVVLTGGVMWAGLFLESWVPDDIDLLVVYDQLETVAEALETLGWHLEVSSMATTNSWGCPVWRTRWCGWKSVISFVRSYSYGPINMEVVVVTHGISDALARHDLRSCASSFDGQKVEVVDPCRTLVRKSQVCARRLALINGLAVSLAMEASRMVSSTPYTPYPLIHHTPLHTVAPYHFLHRRAWFAGLDAGMQAVQLAGFDPEGFHELMDAMRSDEISLPFCSSVCQLTCLCKLGGR